MELGVVWRCLRERKRDEDGDKPLPVGWRAETRQKKRVGLSLGTSVGPWGWRFRRQEWKIDGQCCKNGYSVTERGE